MLIEVFEGRTNVSLNELRKAIDLIPQYILLPYQYAFSIKSNEENDQFIKKYYENNNIKNNKLTHLVYVLTPFKNYSIKKRMDYGIAGINYPSYIGDKDLQIFFDDLESEARSLMKEAVSSYHSRYRTPRHVRNADVESFKARRIDLESKIEEYYDSKTKPLDPFELCLPNKNRDKELMLFAIPCDVDVRKDESDMVIVGPNFVSYLL